MSLLVPTFFVFDMISIPPQRKYYYQMFLNKYCSLFTSFPPLLIHMNNFFLLINSFSQRIFHSIACVSREKRTKLEDNYSHDAIYIGLKFPSFFSIDFILRFELLLIWFRSLVSKTLPLRKPLSRVLIKTTLRLLFNMAHKVAAGNLQQKKQTRPEVKEK